MMMIYNILILVLILDKAAEPVSTGPAGACPHSPALLRHPGPACVYRYGLRTTISVPLEIQVGHSTTVLPE